MCAAGTVAGFRCGKSEMALDQIDQKVAITCHESMDLIMSFAVTIRLLSQLRLGLLLLV